MPERIRIYREQEKDWNDWVALVFLAATPYLLYRLVKAVAR